MYVGATVFNPAVNAILIPLTQHRFHNGAIGAATALALTETLIACAGFAIVGRGIVGLSGARRVGAMALACGGMWLVVHLLSGVVGPILSLPAGFVAFAILAIVFRAVTEQEQRQIRGMAQRFAARAAVAVSTLHARVVRRRPAEATGGRPTRGAAPVRPLENAPHVPTEPSATAGDVTPLEI